MSDPSAVQATDLVVRLALEAFEKRIQDLRDEVSRIANESERRQRDFARLTGELSRWLTAKSGAEGSMRTRLDELETAVKRLSEVSPRAY